MRSMKYPARRTPELGNRLYASVNRRRVVSNVPRKIVGSAGMLSPRPTLRAMSRALSSPASSPTRTLIVLRERISPVSAGSTPPKVPSEFAGLHFGASGSSPGRMAASLMFAPGKSPRAQAAV